MSTPHQNCSLRVLAWLIDVGPGVSDDVRNVLVGQLQSSRAAAIMAAVNSVALNAIALFLHYHIAFIVLLLLNAGYVVTEFALRRTIGLAVHERSSPPQDAYLLLRLLWCALQGGTAFAAMLTGSHVLQMLVGLNTLAIIGPTCARNYATPRLALTMICLIDLPLAAGVALIGEPWLLILVAQTPVFLYGSYQVMLNFQRLAVTALQAQYDSQLRARRDPLTGLLNRLAFMDMIDRKADRNDDPLVLICLDLDGFKQANDLFGHHVGDALLQAVSRRLEACVQPWDEVIRLGGDEFLIVADRMDAVDAVAFTRRLIEQVAHEPYLLEGAHLVSVGLSVGYACVPEDGTCLDALHRRADAALYAAKAQGKGVARRHQPDPARLVEPSVKRVRFSQPWVTP